MNYYCNVEEKCYGICNAESCVYGVHLQQRASLQPPFCIYVLSLHQLITAKSCFLSSRFQFYFHSFNFPGMYTPYKYHKPTPFTAQFLLQYFIILFSYEHIFFISHVLQFSGSIEIVSNFHNLVFTLNFIFCASSAVSSDCQHYMDLTYKNLFSCLYS